LGEKGQGGAGDGVLGEAGGAEDEEVGGGPGLEERGEDGVLWGGTLDDAALQVGAAVGGRVVAAVGRGGANVLDAGDGAGDFQGFGGDVVAEAAFVGGPIHGEAEERVAEAVGIRGVEAEVVIAVGEVFADDRDDADAVVPFEGGLFPLGAFWGQSAVSGWRFEIVTTGSRSASVEKEGETARNDHRNQKP